MTLLDHIKDKKWK